MSYTDVQRVLVSKRKDRYNVYTVYVCVCTAYTSLHSIYSVTSPGRIACKRGSLRLRLDG